MTDRVEKEIDSSEEERKEQATRKKCYVTTWTSIESSILKKSEKARKFLVRKYLSDHTAHTIVVTVEPDIIDQILNNVPQWNLGYHFTTPFERLVCHKLGDYYRCHHSFRTLYQTFWFYSSGFPYPNVSIQEIAAWRVHLTKNLGILVHLGSKKNKNLQTNIEQESINPQTGLRKVSVLGREVEHMLRQLKKLEKENKEKAAQRELEALNNEETEVEKLRKEFSEKLSTQFV
ncbi:hypothetical protein RF11_10639 [Thelohanellus kitauei]|uniref:Uncharacterized protein n=1 Tax=Thelohanellus kitauei TaxID=669202 RepID=A0A0C2MY47_THEKT|nr:hypothetical protein RF11_10639 [Thelohanellus kitauei]